MKRWGTRTLICLSLGAVTTVGVAWGCALMWTAPLNLWGSGMSPQGRLFHWQFGIYEGPGVKRVFSWARSNALIYSAEIDTAIAQPPAWSRVNDPTPPYSGRQIANLFPAIEDARGWPFVALRSTMHGKEAPWVDIGLSSVDWGIHLFSRASTVSSQQGAQNVIHFKRSIFFERALPVRPIWPGLALDVFCYAALWFGLIVGFGAMKRTLRTRRGLCPKCAYDLRGNLDPGCPECGWNRSDDQPPGGAGG